MAKVDILRLDSVTANDTTATALINENFEAIQDALENTLSRDGTVPNYMDANLDMNSYKIINLSDPVDDLDVVNLRYLKTFVGNLEALTAQATSAANSALRSATDAGNSAQIAAIARETAVAAKNLSEAAAITAETAASNALTYKNAAQASAQAAAASAEYVVNNAPEATVTETETGAIITTKDLTHGEVSVEIFNGEQGEQGPQGLQGPQGPAGAAGADGYSPSASVSKVGAVATITITDKTGTTTAQISDGESGTYTAGAGIAITGDEISVDNSTSPIEAGDTVTSTNVAGAIAQIDTFIGREIDKSSVLETEESLASTIDGQVTLNLTDLFAMDIDGRPSEKRPGALVVTAASDAIGIISTVTSTTATITTIFTGVDALPSQTGQSGKFLTTDGTSASWATVAAGGNFKGTYDSSATYNTGDYVRYASGDTRYWVCDIDGTVGQTPSEGIYWHAFSDTYQLRSDLVTDNANYQLLLTANTDSIQYTGKGKYSPNAPKVNASTGDIVGYAKTTDLPTVNNSQITFTQGGTTKGSFTLNQSTGTTIELDAGGSGSVDIDNSTITTNVNDEIQAEGTLNHNTAAGATNPVYNWVGTLAEYEAQTVATSHPEWICFITDDNSIVYANAALSNLTAGLTNTICTTAPTTISSASSATPAVVVENYRNGMDWYRIWSDGWCEQGGTVLPASSTTGTAVTLHKEMADTNYSVQLTQNAMNTGYGISAGNASTTGFSCRAGSSASANLLTCWEVKGLIA